MVLNQITSRFVELPLLSNVWKNITLNLVCSGSVDRDSPRYIWTINTVLVNTTAQPNLKLSSQSLQTLVVWMEKEHGFELYFIFVFVLKNQWRINSTLEAQNPASSAQLQWTGMECLCKQGLHIGKKANTQRKETISRNLQ